MVNLQAKFLTLDFNFCHTSEAEEHVGTWEGGENKLGNLGLWIISMQLCMHKPLAKNLMKVTLEKL